MYIYTYEVTTHYANNFLPVNIYWRNSCFSNKLKFNRKIITDKKISILPENGSIRFLIEYHTKIIEKQNKSDIVENIKVFAFINIVFQRLLIHRTVENLMKSNSKENWH